MRQEEINSILERAKNYSGISCEDVLFKVIGYTGKTIKKGNNLFFQCLNGCEEKSDYPEKCSINVSENKGKCFQCGFGFGPIKLLSVAKSIPYNEAALILAKLGGEITDEEFNAVTKSASNYNKLIKDSHVHAKIEQKKADEVKDFKASPDVLDLVYRHMLKLPQFRLSMEMLEYLFNERDIEFEDLSKSKFFYYKEPFSIDELVKNIQEEQPAFTYNHFWGVPGFYFEFSDKTHKQGKWKFRDPYKDCLGIPLMDAEGRIVGLQMRFMNNEQISSRKVAKYFFVSSRGYKPKSGAETGYGTCSGTPAHVEYPDVVTNSWFVIGEGKFKMMEAAKEGSVAFSCQGVGNYRYVLEEIDHCLKSKKLLSKMSRDLLENPQKLKFLIMYDADMFHNYAVLDNAIKLHDELKKIYGREIVFLLWDEKYGKGYDDMKHNLGENFKEYLLMVDGTDFCSLMRANIARCDDVYKKSHKNICGEGFRGTDEYKILMKTTLWDGCILKNYSKDGTVKFATA